MNNKESCDGCEPSRRRFLALALERAAAIGAVLGIASALPLEPIEAMGSSTRDTKSYPVPGADGVFIDKQNDVILVRWKGALYAFSLACPHQNTALRWLEADSRFQCPKHKSKYQPNGTFIEGRATRSMDRFGISVSGGNVLVNLDALYEEDKQPEAWAKAQASIPA